MLPRWAICSPTFPGLRVSGQSHVADQGKVHWRERCLLLTAAGERPIQVSPGFPHMARTGNSGPQSKDSLRVDLAQVPRSPPHTHTSQTHTVGEKYLFYSFSLEYNCFAMLWPFLFYSEVNQLYVYLYPLPSRSFLPVPHPHPTLQVITGHQAELPLLYSSFLLAIYLTHGTEKYIFAVLSPKDFFLQHNAPYFSPNQYTKLAQ